MTSRSDVLLEQVKTLSAEEQEIGEAANFYAREAPGIVGRLFLDAERIRGQDQQIHPLGRLVDNKRKRVSSRVTTAK